MQICKNGCKRGLKAFSGKGPFPPAATEGAGATAARPGRWTRGQKLTLTFSYGKSEGELLDAECCFFQDGSGLGVYPPLFFAKQKKQGRGIRSGPKAPQTPAMGGRFVGDAVYLREREPCRRRRQGSRAIAQGWGIKSGVGRKVNLPTSFFPVREKMGWGVVVRKPAGPKRSPALLVCVLIQKGGMKRRSGRFPFQGTLLRKERPAGPTNWPAGRASATASRPGRWGERPKSATFPA